MALIEGDPGHKKYIAALEQDAAIPEMQNVTNRQEAVKLFIKHYWKGFIPLILMLLGVITMSLFLVIGFHLIFFMILIPLSLLFPVIILVGIQNMVGVIFMKEFAASHGYSFEYFKENREFLSTLIHATEGVGTASNGITGTYQSIPFKLFNYAYSTKSNSAGTSLTVIEVSIAQDTLPVIILDSLKFGISELEGLDGKGLMKLEGDFQKYFQLYVPTGYDLEALQIFTPDVMLYCQDTMKLINIELHKDKVYFYTYQMQSVAGLESYLNRCMTFIEKIQSVSKNVRINEYFKQT